MAGEAPREMRLRYAGTCRMCGVVLAAGVTAIYEPQLRKVRCLECDDAPPQTDEQASPEATQAESEAALTPDHEVDVGQAGASARREHQRRHDKRQARIREAHPVIGGALLAVFGDPQSTTAWATGAVGEEKLGARLDSIASPNIRLLHDRRIPGSRANIDHIAIAPSGVYVIDAKRYQGRPDLRVRGGFLTSRTETLVVGGRNCTPLVDGVLKQVEVVRQLLQVEPELAAAEVQGVLCFVEADWGLLDFPFTTRGITVNWPKAALKRLRQEGPLDLTRIGQLHTYLAQALPKA